MAETSPEYGPAATVAVVGLGQRGLPVAAQYASRGLRVIGRDANPAVVAAVPQAHHDACRDLDLAAALPGRRVVLDGRYTLDPGRVEAAGVLYLGIGRGARVPVLA